MESTKGRASILDILEMYDTIDLPFNEYLSMLPPMRARYYSISSSPLASATLCTITYSVINEASHSGHGQFIGVASSYLRSLQAGDSIRVAVKPANKQFRLPLQGDRIPIMMFCAGTGLAPFRGFIQHRVAMMKAGTRSLAPALLFVGCRSSVQDRLYADELDAWSKLGAVDVRVAFSEESDHEDSCGCAHVQDRMWRDREIVGDMWEKGAKIYVCGSPGLAKAIGDTAKDVAREKLKEQGRESIEEDKLREWFVEQKGERFVTDVFA